MNPIVLWIIIVLIALSAIFGVIGTQVVQQDIAKSLVTATGTFAETELVLPQSDVKGQLPGLIGVTIQHPRLGANNATGDYSKWQLTVIHETALTNMSDDNCIAYGERIKTGTTGAGVANSNQPEETIERVMFPAPIPISSLKIFFGAHQVTNAAHTYNIKLHFTTVYLPGVVQRNNLVNQTNY